MSNGIPLFGKPPPKPKKFNLDVTFHNRYFINENEYHKSYNFRICMSTI